MPCLEFRCLAVTEGKARLSQHPPLGMEGKPGLQAWTVTSGSIPPGGPLHQDRGTGMELSPRVMAHITHRAQHLASRMQRWPSTEAEEVRAWRQRGALTPKSWYLHSTGGLTWLSAVHVYRNPGMEAGSAPPSQHSQQPTRDYPDPLGLCSTQLEKLVPAEVCSCQRTQEVWLLSGPFGFLTSGVVDERELCHQGSRNWP